MLGLGSIFAAFEMSKTKKPDKIYAYSLDSLKRDRDHENDLNAPPEVKTPEEELEGLKDEIKEIDESVEWHHTEENRTKFTDMIVEGLLKSKEDLK